MQKQRFFHLASIFLGHSDMRTMVTYYTAVKETDYEVEREVRVPLLEYPDYLKQYNISGR